MTLLVDRLITDQEPIRLDTSQKAPLPKIHPLGDTLWLSWQVNNWINELGSPPPQTSAIQRMIPFSASKLVAVSPTGG